MNTFVNSQLLAPPCARSSSYGASARRWLDSAGKGIWSALEASGRARAHQALIEFADRCEASQPDLATQLRTASRHSLLA